MSVRSALVAILCSAILSAGLAIGLGASGAAGAASSGSAASQLKGSTASQLKGIKAELEKVNDALGNPASYHTIFQELQEICKNTDKAADGGTGILCG